ncbi:alpha/beta fold hydrolase [Paenibacillus sp. GCM10027628]|uniref:alpha/beta fold hydrolase n=1 Tax=Paenibacillus sp. GCM10027628 TaxID=3273413 RepID=UPI003644EED5
MRSLYRKPAGEALLNQAYNATLSAWKVPYESVQVPTTFGQTHVLVAGPADGEPLVLLHGYGFSSTSWIDNIESLSAQYRVYAVDFIGDMNRSVAKGVIHTKEQCADWFAQVMEGLGVASAHVMGLSYGAFVGMIVSRLLPDRIRSLISISPGGAIQPQRKGFFLRCMMAGMLPSRARINRLMDYMKALGNEVNPIVREQFVIALQNCLPQVRLHAGYMSDDELRAIKCPVLLLLGEYEVQYNPEKGLQRAKQLIANLQGDIIAGTGHGLSLERPDLVNPLVLKFLQQHEGSRRNESIKEHAV